MQNDNVYILLWPKLVIQLVFLKWTCVIVYRCRVSSHFFSACSVVGFRHPVSLLQSLHESEGISSWEGSLTSTEDLPHCHTIWPLQRHGENSWLLLSGWLAIPLLLLFTYHVTFLREMAITETLWSHPLDWQFNHFPTSSLPEVVLLKHILWQTKVSDFDQKVWVNPRES